MTGSGEPRAVAREARKTAKSGQNAANGSAEAGEAFVVRALAKGLAMVGLFDDVHREWTLDEMVAELQLPRMTGYRMARTLQSAGYLIVDRQNGRYRLGPAMLAATYLSEGYAELVGIARPYLGALVTQTGESATLAVDVDGVAVCVDMVDSPRPHKREVAVGRIIGDTANAHGKVYAAFMPEPERGRLLAQPHKRMTPRTIIDPAQLEAELARIRDEGVAFDIEERNLGTCAVAAPVRDQMGSVIGSISVVVPTGRFGEAERATCVQAIKQTAADLSGFLGYAGADPRA
jgi:IclR family transcriptional regulator, KDG regulon repressor